MTTITGKLVSELKLGDRISIPGTSIEMPIRFIWARGSDVLIELENGDTRIWPAVHVVRVVTS